MRHLKYCFADLEPSTDTYKDVDVPPREVSFPSSPTAFLLFSVDIFRQSLCCNRYSQFSFFGVISTTTTSCSLIDQHPTC